jgi:hypothetical protein
MPNPGRFPREPDFGHLAELPIPAIVCPVRENDID